MLRATLRATLRPTFHPGRPIPQQRRWLALVTRLTLPARGVDFTAATRGGVPGEFVATCGLAAAHGTVLYLHGGAWCVHLPALYGTFATKLSAATGLRVLLVDYRLAPEHPFPAAVDDSLAVYRAVVDDAGTRPQAIAGDSAGGNLALVTLMRARDAQLPLPACAVLLSPATDIALGGPSIRYNALADPMFSAGAGDLLPSLYCPGLERTDPLISPLYGDWGGLPPLYFVAGSTEMLLDDSVRAHDRAEQAGTQSRIDVWPSMPHVFPLFSMLPEARRALGDIVDFIAQHPLRAAAILPAREPLGALDPAAATDVAQAVPQSSVAL